MPQALLVSLPLGKTPAWADRLNKYSLASYAEWTDFKVFYEVSLLLVMYFQPCVESSG
jgi:hypothetical protein